MRTRPTARRWSPATIRKSRPSRPIAKSTMPAPGDASAFATDTETSPHRPPCRPDTGSEPRNAREGRSPSHKPIHHRTCDGADADARNRRHAQSQIGRSLNFALSRGYANATRSVRTGPWVPTGPGPETPAPGGKAEPLWPGDGVCKRQEDLLLARRRLAVCPRRLRACLGVLVELSAPPAGPASAPRRRKLRGGDHGRRARRDRGRRRRYRVGGAAGLVMAALCSTLVAGCAWPPAAASGRGPRRRFAARSAGWRRRGGGCGTRSRVAGAGISTASRSPRPESGSRSRLKRARSMHATWAAPGRRPRGFTGIAAVGADEERSRCCASCTPAGWRRSWTRFSWCHLTAWRRRSELALERHHGPRSSRCSPRPAEREALLGC